MDTKDKVTSGADKTELVEIVRSVGKWYGDYSEANGNIRIDNGEKVFEYSSYFEAAQDWIYTMLEDLNTDWSKESSMMLAAGIKAVGVRSVPNRAGGCSYMATIDYPNGNGKTCQYSAGTFDNPQEAYAARLDAVALREQFISEGRDLTDFQQTLRDSVKGHVLSSSIGEENKNAESYQGHMLSPEREQELLDRLIGYVGEYFGGSELYDILHNTLEMSHEDMEGLGFDLHDYYEAPDMGQKM